MYHNHVLEKIAVSPKSKYYVFHLGIFNPAQPEPPFMLFSFRLPIFRVAFFPPNYGLYTRHFIGNQNAKQRLYTGRSRSISDD